MIELLNNLGQQWAPVFSLAIVQNTVFLGVIFFALAVFKNADARLKYMIGFIGLVKLLLPPFIPAPFLKYMFSFSQGMATFDIGNLIVVSATEDMHISESLNGTSVLLLIWGATAFVTLIFPLVSTLRLRLKLSDAVPVEFADKDLSSIRIYKSDRINMPLTMGFFSNKIYVPGNWESWSTECRKMILHHELAHIRRRDGLSQALQIIVQAIYFFHPLVWILNMRLNQYREMACDDASVKTKKSSHVEYSRYLVKIAEDITCSELGCFSASALIRQKNELLKRIQYQIKEATMKHISRETRVFVVGLLLVLMVPFSWSFSKISNEPASENSHVKFIDSTGKISGIVIDAKTGEALPDVNIVIEGTSLGAASDIKGKYYIAGVPPGKYNLVASYLGFKTVKVQSIAVKKNLTTKIDFKLEKVMLKVREKQAQKQRQKQEQKEYLVAKKEYEEKVKKIKQYNKEAKKKGSKDFVEIPPPPPPPLLKPSGEEKEFQFVAYDKAPEPIGGFEAITKNLKYPKDARKDKIQGTVIVAAFIDTEGNVAKTAIQKPMEHKGCNEAAVNAVKSVKWKPAIQRDKAVAVWMAIPIEFKLE